MATTATSRSAYRARHRRSLAIAIAALAAPLAHAEFAAQVTAGASHTDNLRLETENEDSELVYRLEPSFSFSKEAAGLSVLADYRLQALRYRDLGESDVYHQYNASLRAALIPDVFFLEAGGSRSQAIVDPELTIPTSNLPISSNRQDRDQYYVEPSFQYAIGANVAATGEYRHSWLEYDTENSRDSEQGEARFSLDNYRKQRGLTWALRYDWQRAEYDIEIPWEYQKAMAELGFWAGANTRFFAAAGKESAWDQPLDPALEDDLWEAGFSHQAGERLRAEFAAGERSFGNSWRGNLEFRFRRGSTSLSYDETPTTEGRVRMLRDVFDDPDLPDDLLTRPGSTERFIAKRLMWTLNLDMRRTSLSLSLFDADRTDRTLADGTPLADEARRGAHIGLSYQVGARTDLRTGGTWTRRDLATGGQSELMHAFLALGYGLGQKTSLSLSYSYAEEDPEGVTVNVRDYVANTVSLDITRIL